ncbi:hypothetical protein BC831DRAFT_443344 [Entophlyctis helioformis]|nr:hypothetical protein BC831DRAFT_443344 [Entophlyctis helioformis]
MAGPPPPPPPGPPPPPPPPASGGGAGAVTPPANNALLKSIQKGTKLKKATTNDRSTPIIDGMPASFPASQLASLPVCDCVTV